MAELGAKKKQRNYFLDFLKVVCCLTAVLSHSMVFLGEFFGLSLLAPANVNGLEYAFSYAFWSFNPVLGMAGIGCISVFTFCSGYWFVDAFKKEQRRNTFGRGKDLTIVSKYACKNYATYWPYILFGVLFHMILFYAIVPELKIFSHYFIKDLIVAIPALLGFRGFGFPTTFFTYLLGSLDYTTPAMVSWSNQLWYMYALLIFLPLYYAVFMKNETLGIFALNTYAFMGYMVTGSNSNLGTSIISNLGIDDSIFRLGGPMAFGIWGWYIVDFLKKKEFTKKGKTAFNIISAISIVWVIYEHIVGTGGFVYFDTAYAVLLIVTLTEKDSIITGINKVLNKFPLSKHFGFLSLALYIIHGAILEAIRYMILTNVYPAFTEFFYSSFPNLDSVVLAVIGISLALCIPFYFLDKHVLKKLTKWVLTFTKATEPVVIEEPAEAK